MSDKLIIAVPSKGRLKEKTEEIFKAVGFEIEAPFGARNYRGVIKGNDAIEVAFLSASEIARELARGKVHLGVTGEDLVKENVARHEDLICQITPLGFGHADVIVAIPACWIDVTNMEDLDDVAASYRSRYGRRLRVATKYWNLTQRFFAGHGISSYRIVDSLGATEGAPAAGLADAIVDITSTGSTLRANHLKLLDDGTILKSQANLFSSKTAVWNDKKRRIVREMLGSLVPYLTSVSKDEVVNSLALGASNRFFDKEK